MTSRKGLVIHIFIGRSRGPKTLYGKESILMNIGEFMLKQKTLTKDYFDDIEQEVVNTAKSLIETFKFKMVYETKVSKKNKVQAVKDVKAFRSKHWDKSLSKKEAYKKYLNLH